MGYVLPKGSSKAGTSYARTGMFKRKTSAGGTVLKLPPSVRIPQPISPDYPRKQFDTTIKTSDHFYRGLTDMNQAATVNARAFDGRTERGLAGKQGSFKPTVPANIVRPKPVQVPNKAK